MHVCMFVRSYMYDMLEANSVPERREVAQLSPELQNIDFTAALLYGY